jgi:hypothetical protein
MMHGKALAFLGVCLRSWRRLCTQKTGWPAEKAELEQALRVAQTSKDTEVRRVEKLQWEARLEAQARTARTRTHPHAPARTRTHPHAPARTRTHLHAPARTCTHLHAPARTAHPAAPPRLSVPSAPVCTLRTLVQARIAELEHALRRGELEGRDGTRHAELHAEERRCVRMPQS